MKAIVYTRYGGPEVLQLSYVEKPVPKENDVLVRVHAASINDWDFGLMQGDFVNRMLNGFLKPKRIILGSDIAGEVEAVGSKVTRFKAGDLVYGDLSGRWGGFAEYACASEAALALKPASMSFAEAAAIPQAAMLAVQGLLDCGNLQKGQSLLINGAGGGVGTFALQVAKIYGATVTGVDSTAKQELMRSMGFDFVKDYSEENFIKTGLQYDLVLDVKTTHSPFDYKRILTSQGTYVTVGGHISRLLQVFLLGPLIAMTTKKKIRIVSLKPNKDLAYINDLYTDGKIKPVIDGPYQLNDFREAFRLFAKSNHKGKVVIIF
ncbi:MAG: NAD(P)-dependent alcohol dehydrogenase [Bacteroidota bacterium]|nr:NAD(P)-dependent alcohol dehydrogenase [Bacteroidota bacterium]